MGRFVDAIGSLGRGRRPVSSNGGLSEEDVKDPARLSDALARYSTKLSALETRSVEDFVEFDILCPYHSTIKLNHGFTGAYRWYVTSWRRKSGAGPCCLTELDGASSDGTLVLYSQVPGRAVVRVESVQNAQIRDDTTRTTVEPGGAGAANLEFGADVLTANTVYTRMGARVLDMSDYPSATTVKFAVTLENSLHSSAWSTRARLFDITHNVAVTGTTLDNSAASDKALAAQQISVALTVGSSSGNIRNDVATMYAVQLQATGTVSDPTTQWAIASNARLIIS